MIKILLVDDDVANSMFLKQYLETEGFEVAYAKDGNAGYGLYRSLQPQLILLDVNMPGMNGFELAQLIRETDSDVLIFFLTDRTGKEDRLKGFIIKGNDYIPKPFYPEELVAKIKERLSDRQIMEETVAMIGDTRYDSNLSSLTFEDVSVTISERQNEILKILVGQIGRMVARDYILETVWSDVSYRNSLALNVQINYLRKLLSPDKSVVIDTLHKRGYVLRIKAIPG